MASHTYEITVIGGGPVGMFATFYAGLRSADVLLVESLATLGGQPGNLYPAKIMYDLGAIPAVSGAALIEALTKQVAHFKPAMQTATAVTAINAQPDGTFELTTTGAPIHTKTVIIATGGGAFKPRRLAIAYEPALDDQIIQYVVRDPHDFAGQTIAIAGGGDSAIDWALTLAPVAKAVHLIHRRDQFRGLESSVAALRESSATIHTPFLIQGLKQTGAQATITLKEVRGARTESLVVDRLLVNYGFMSDNKQLTDWGVTVTDGTIAVNSQMATSRPGIYAIGDVAGYPGKLKLIATGFGEAPIAVNEALSRLYPERRQALHSSQLYH